MVSGWELGDSLVGVVGNTHHAQRRRLEFFRVGEATAKRSQNYVGEAHPTRIGLDRIVGIVAVAGNLPSAIERL